MTNFAHFANELAETGFVPDALVRKGIQRLVAERKSRIAEHDSRDLDAFVYMMNRSNIALVPELANEQHYEVPATFFEEALGKHRKYSCCYWSDGAQNLDQAEEAALRLSCERAALEDDFDILELGCGWGSLSLWMAGQYPHARVTSVSNSSSQKTYIDGQAKKRGLANLRVITADMNEFDTDQTFDRVVSIEMFEHMRNYSLLFERISRWLRPDGHFFMHIFCHRSAAYEYVDQGPSDWMSRHFFSGGIMPSGDLPQRFQDHLQVVDQWRWSGREYQKTAEAWLRNMDDRKARAFPVIAHTYGEKNARRWWQRWRIFFLAVSEMFGTDDGREWGVGHYLLSNKAAAGGLGEKIESAD
ncbi:MAG: SAM-dependent methyltransferase [Woeseiaceae bacterium]